LAITSRFVTVQPSEYGAKQRWPDTVPRSVKYSFDAIVHVPESKFAVVT
jgi:hypothetical protein